MATKLTKNVKRETLAVKTMGKYRDRPIIVTLEPGDVLSFRIKGTRQEASVSLAHCYQLAQIVEGEVRYKQKVKEYKEKKKLGYRHLRRPKKMDFPFNKIYINALK